MSANINLLYEMYYAGILNKGDDNNFMMRFNSLDNSIYVEFERKEYSNTFINESNVSPGNDNFTGYFCIYRFKDCITDRVLLEINSPIEYTFSMYDIIEEWMSFNNSYECIIAITPQLPNGSSFFFTLNLFDIENYSIQNTVSTKDYPDYVLTVREYNIYTERFIDRVKLLLGYSNEVTDSSLEDFINSSFFVFCIDKAELFNNSSFINVGDEFIPI